MEPDDRDWRAKQPAASAAAAAPAEASTTTAAAPAAGGEGRWLQEAGNQAGGKAREPPRMAPSGAAAPSTDGQQAQSGSAPAQPPRAPQVSLHCSCMPIAFITQSYRFTQTTPFR